MCTFALEILLNKQTEWYYEKVFVYCVDSIRVCQLAGC